MSGFIKTSLIIPAIFATEQLKEMTMHCMQSQRENVQLILIADDAPYTVNVNAGLRAATGDVIVVGNNDLAFPEQWLQRLLRPLDEGFDIATCWTSDQKDIVLTDDIEPNVKFGSLFAMKREVYDTIGGFDEQFEGYFADTDYRKRAMDAGFKIGRNNNMVIHHKAKATYKVTDPSDIEFQKAKVLFEQKYGYGSDED